MPKVFATARWLVIQDFDKGPVKVNFQQIVTPRFNLKCEFLTRPVNTVSLGEHYALEQTQFWYVMVFYNTRLRQCTEIFVFIHSLYN